MIGRSTTNPSVHEIDDTSKLLDDFDNLSLSDVIFWDRISYRKAVKDGIAVVELKPKGSKSVDKMETLYNEVFADELIKKQTSG